MPLLKDLVKLISIRAHSKTKVYQRSVYNFLDFIGDVGGLLDGLKLICQTLLIPFSSFNFTSYILTKLFFVRKEKEKS